MYVKVEFTNPGGSVKDRIGITMIDEAEKKGCSSPAARLSKALRKYRHGAGARGAVRGYKCVFTTR